MKKKNFEKNSKKMLPLFYLFPAELLPVVPQRLEHCQQPAVVPAYPGRLLLEHALAGRDQRAAVAGDGGRRRSGGGGAAAFVFFCSSFRASASSSSSRERFLEGLPGLGDVLDGPGDEAVASRDVLAGQLGRAFFGFFWIFLDFFEFFFVFLFR